MSNHNAARFSAWVILTALSALCLASHLTHLERERLFFDDTVPKRTQGQNAWLTSVASISTGLSFVAVLAYFVARTQFVGEKTEIGVALLISLVWAGGLPVITGPAIDIAGGFLTTIDANLYFLSWGAFDVTLYIVSCYADAYANTMLWCYLCLSSTVVMGSSARLFRSNPCSAGEDIEDSIINCKRLQLAIGVGASCTVACLVVMSLLRWRDGGMGLYPEMGVAIVVTILYTFAVSFLTFGEVWGSLVLGNLYAFSWLGFTTALILASRCVYKVVLEKDEEEGDPKTAPDNKEARSEDIPA
mmetsp:Transcript_19529/g.39570  ORF Transcript_19529/g.39570 Transcript_19529/m.39570 type:complete len:302 (-) Transcript_19529:252-1157(-)